MGSSCSKLFGNIHVFSSFVWNTHGAFLFLQHCVSSLSASLNMHFVVCVFVLCHLTFFLLLCFCLYTCFCLDTLGSDLASPMCLTVLCVVCFCLDIVGSDLASPLCLTLFLWSSDLVLVRCILFRCYLLCSLYLVVFVCSFWS